TLGAQDGRNVRGIDPDALEVLRCHDWPGNVRELANVVHRSLLACQGELITVADLPPDLRALALPQLPAMASEPPYSVLSERVVPLRELERRAIAHALRVAGGSVGKAAKLLGIGRATLYRRIASEGVTSLEVS